MCICNLQIVDIYQNIRPRQHTGDIGKEALKPEVAVNPSTPVKTTPVLMPSGLELWRTGVS